MRLEPATSTAGAEVDGPAGERSEPAPARRRRRRRWGKWLVFALVLLILRLAVPALLAPLVARRLSHALGTRVEIGDLSFQPLDCIFTLRNVTVRAPTGTDSEAAPPIVARRARIDIQWLPLLHQQVNVRELALESARVDLDRLPDGTFSLANLDSADPARELPAGWTFALDGIALRDSELRVRDLAAGGAALLEATIRNADIAGIHRRITAFGKSKNLRVDAIVGGGHLRVQGHYEMRDDGLLLDTSMHVKNMPLTPLSPYVSHLGWSGLVGSASGRLRWQREPRRRDLLSGRVIARRTSVQVGGLTEPALDLRRAVVDVSAIDLLTRRIAIGSLTLRGVSVPLNPDFNVPLPLFPTALTRPVRPAGKPARLATAVPRWSWMVERFAIVDGRAHVLAPDERIELRWSGSGENLGPGAYWSPVRMQVARRQTSAAFEGTARLETGVIIEGRLTAGGIDFPGLARATALPWADITLLGNATADLTVQLDTAADAPLDARGSIALTDLLFAGNGPEIFAVGSTAVDLTLASLTLGDPGGGDQRKQRPTQIAFSSANIIAPFALLTRTDDGWVLPPFPTLDAPPQPAAAVEITVRDARSAGGSLMLVDLVPEPHLTIDLTHLNGGARHLTLPALAYDGLQMRGSDPRFGTLQLGGSYRGGTNSFELAAEGMPLTAATPYLGLAGVPYRFAAGKGSFHAHGTSNQSRWNAEAWLTMQTPELSVVDPAFDQSVGMTLSSAMAALRDQNGDVTLQLALASPQSGRAAYADQIAASVRSSIVNAREASAAAVRQEVATLPAVSIPFLPGQTQLSLSAMQELSPLTEALRTRPGLIVEILAPTSAKDRRWLAEQAVQGRLDDSGGFRGVLRVLGMRDAHARIRTALAARARGAPGFLDADDEAVLSELIAEGPPIDSSKLTTLRDQRIAQLMRYLVDDAHVTKERVVARADAGPEDSGTPNLQVTLALAPNANAAAAPSEPN